MEQKKNIECLRYACEKEFLIVQSELPAVLYKEVEEIEEWIEMADGIKLFARVTMPKKSGKWPVILIRSPYIVMDFMERIRTVPAFAMRGYAVVYNHVRGTIRSEGEWLPFENEKEDGKKVIEWIAEQDWCNGNIGTLGSSYSGCVQWCLAGDHHPMLKTMFISMFGPDPYKFIYCRGMFRQDIGTGWAAMMMGENRYHYYDRKEEAELRKKANKVLPPRMLGEEIIGETCTWYNTWIENSSSDCEYWNSGFWKAVQEAPSKMQIPVFLHGGWYDVFGNTMIDGWKRLPKHIREKSTFIMGPWSHVLTTGNTLEYPNENKAGTLYIKAALEWFDYQLKGKENKYPLGCMDAYNIGAGSWVRCSGKFLDSTNEYLYLACNQCMTGKLLTKVPEKTGKKVYYYNPDNPVNSCGGALLFNMEQPEVGPACSTWQPEIGEREDVINFLSERFENGIQIAGGIKVELYVSTDALATSFTVKINEEFSDGKSVNIVDSISDIRFRKENEFQDYQSGEIVKLELQMADICWKLQCNSRIRLDISSSNFPAYHVHPNVAGKWSDNIEHRIAKQTIYCGNTYPSRIIIPVQK